MIKLIIIYVIGVIFVGVLIYSGLRSLDIKLNSFQTLVALSLCLLSWITIILAITLLIYDKDNFM